jgi:ribosomal protein S21
MVKTGIIIETKTPEPAETPKTIEKIKTADNVKITEEKPPLIKAKLVELGVDIVHDNKDDFQDLSEEQTTKLLRKLLLARLAPSEIEKKTKKKKKKKKKLIKVESSDSDSDSDSD